MELWDSISQRVPVAGSVPLIFNMESKGCPEGHILIKGGHCRKVMDLVGLASRANKEVLLEDEEHDSQDIALEAIDSFT